MIHKAHNGMVCPAVREKLILYKNTYKMAAVTPINYYKRKRVIILLSHTHSYFQTYSLQTAVLKHLQLDFNTNKTHCQHDYDKGLWDM